MAFNIDYTELVAVCVESYWFCHETTHNVMRSSAGVYLREAIVQPCSLRGELEFGELRSSVVKCHNAELFV